MTSERATEDASRARLARCHVARVPRSTPSAPSKVRAMGLPFREASLPATLASVLREHGELDFSRLPRFEDDDAWFIAEIPKLSGDGRRVLVFEGLATLARVFLNDRLVLESTNAFLRHEVDVTEHLRGDDVLAMHFASLDAHLAEKRPRPRWKTRIVESQNLRFVRTPLLGRTTGFCPATPVLGPYRPIHLERRTFSVTERRLAARREGDDGVVALGLSIAGLEGVRAARLCVGDASAALRVEGTRLSGECRMPGAKLWWPHTHGEPHLYASRVVVDHAGGELTIPLGSVGFRSIARDPGDGFGVVVNGVPIFARGAVWTTEDVVLPHATPERLRESLLRVRAAGMNMLRVGGTTTYESEAFHDLADELGILVFQDLMFANMDYPIDDLAFRASVEAELGQLFDRIAWRPSTAVVCGNSEVEQQAAMLGLSADVFRNVLFGDLAPAMLAARDATIPYAPSSPHGGTMPFHVDQGLGHYYGVGAYLRPIEDARTTRVAFASECLAFANVPARATIESFLRDLEAPVHHPRWKERVPRDRGASWDFEDVREHYTELLFGVSARTLRYEDPERYLALSRVTSGEVMRRVFAEWRSGRSPCRGGLVFFLQDFWPGAGFGLVDAHGVPKAALAIVARSLAPLALLLLDEGVNGLDAYVVNDRPQRVEATLRVRTVRDGHLELARVERALTIPGHGSLRVHVDALFPSFVDTTYAYRFGPASHDLVHVELLDASGSVLARAYHLPLGLGRAVEIDLGIDARFEDDHRWLRVRAKRLATFCALDLEGLVAEDDFFHLAPGEERAIALRRVPSARSLRGSIHPSNQRDATRIA